MSKEKHKCPVCGEQYMDSIQVKWCVDHHEMDKGEYYDKNEKDV